MKIDLLRLSLRISFSISAQRSASDGSLGFFLSSILFTSLVQNVSQIGVKNIAKHRERV